MVLLPRLGRAVAAVMLLAMLAPGAHGHDIPDQIILHGYVKPEGDRLHFLVRVPLVMLLNLNLPKRGPGFLALDRIDDALTRAAEATAREIVLFENGRQLEPGTVRARISRASDTSFSSYESARDSIAGPPLPPVTDVFWNQGYFDAHLEYAVSAEDADFALDLRVAPGLKNRLKLILRYLPPGGGTRAYELHYGTGPVHLDPSWHHAARTFLSLGVTHILDGIDHLLFLLCLVAPFRLRHLWSLVAVVTGFTVAHSITLIAAASGLVPTGDWFPPLVETLIAASILYMAIENVLGVDLRYRWIVTSLFGLVHGFGFSFVLEQELQLAGEHFLLSLLAFNVGVEVGQLAFVLVVLPALAWILRGPRLERAGLILLSVLVGHTAWHWMLERIDALRPVDGVDLGVGGVLLAVAGLAAVAGVAWWRARGTRRRRPVGAAEERSS